MAAAETLRITRHIDDTMKDVDQRLVGVYGGVQGVDRLVKGVDHKVGSVIEGAFSLHWLPSESLLRLLLV